MQFALWQIAPGKILTRQELGLVLIDLKHKAKRSRNGRLNLILFRLACCCGLRVTINAVATGKSRISRAARGSAQAD